MALKDREAVEMQDKPDGGCLSAAADEEREPCLKETAAADKNNGVVAAAAGPDGKKVADDSSKNGKFYVFAAASSLEEKLRARSGLSRTGLAVAAALVILCVLLFVALTVLVVIWPRPPRPFPICRRAACLRASAEVLPKINFTQQPCDDFREYACGGWLQTNDLPRYMSSWNLKKRMQQEQRVKIRNMVVTLRNAVSTSSLNWKMKYFYETCMNLDSIESDEGKPLKKIIMSLGGWNVLKNFDVFAWDMTNTMSKLHSKYNVNPFFKVDVVNDDKASGQNIIQLSPAGLGLPDRRYYYRQLDGKIATAYKHYMVDVSQLLGANSGDAATFSTNMFHYETRLAEITPAIKQEDPFTSHRRMKLSKLHEIAANIPVLDVLQSMFPQNGINDETYISVVSPYYFSNLSNLISTTDRNILNDYHMWKLAEAYVPYLSVKFRDVVEIYNAELTGKKELPPRWETCVSLLQNIMGLGVSASLERNVENKAGVVNLVKDVFKNIKGTIRSHVVQSIGLETELRDHVLRKLDSLTLQIGLPDHMLQESYMNQFYSLLMVQRVDFFLNLYEAISFKNDHGPTKLKSKKEEYGELDDLVSDNPKVTYNVASNKVIVPFSLLSSPYFEVGYPEALLYGGLGVEISSAIMSSVYPPGVAYSNDGVLMNDHTAAVARSVGATAEARTCFSQFKDQRVDVANNTALTGMLSLSSVRYALESLLEKTQSEKRFHQPAMESYEYDELFFIAYAQSLCTIKSPQQQELDTMYDLMSNESILLKTITDHSASFKNAFHCVEDPIETCEFVY